MISSASASEINETQTLSLPSDMSDNNNDDVLSVENINESSADKNSGNLLGESNGNRDLLGADAGTFAELQTIINNAQSWATITLDRDYVGSGNQITIDKPLTINGNGYTLDANSKSRIFYITGSNVVLNNMLITNGATYYGGAIYSKGSNLNINNMTFSYCKATRGSNSDDHVDGGGAIYIESNSLIVKNSAFFNCTAPNRASGANGAMGGAIYSLSTITVDNCSFSGCSVSYSGGAISIGQTYTNIKNSKISNSKFVDCKITMSNSPNGHYAGAIQIAGHDGAEIDNCEFIRCSSTVKGGAVHTGTNAVNTIISNSSFVNCTSKEGGSIGAYVSSSKGLNVINCNFKGSKATSGNGGAIFIASQDSMFINCTFDNNYASNLGGVFYSGHQNNEFINCSGRNNTAKQGAVIYINAANNLVDGCNFRDNYASTYDVIYMSGNNNKLLNSVFVNNTSTGTILSTSGTGVVINNSIIIENKGTNIIYSSTSNGCTADYNWFGNSEDNYNTRPTCNNYNNVKITKWYYLNLMAEQAIVAENQDVTMNMGLHGLYDSNTGKKTESLDYNSIPFYLVPDEFLPGEFTLTTDNGQTSVPSKVFTNKDCTFTYTPENMDTGTVTGTNSFGQTIFETITVIKAGSFTDLYNRINYTEENNVLELPYKFEYDDTYDPTHLDTLYGLGDVSGGLPIDKNISINGNYNTINGLNQVDIFNITSNVELENVNLRNGQINNNGNLTLKNVNHRGSEYSVVNNGNLYLEKDYDLMTIKNNGMIYGPFTITVMNNQTVVLQIDYRITNINATTDFGVTIEGGKLSFNRKILKIIKMNKFQSIHFKKLY